MPGERSPATVLLLQFVVVPLAIVLFCVVLYFIFRWFTYERRDVNDYLNALNTRSSSSRQEAALGLLNYIQEAKRWQSLSDLTQQLQFDRQKFLQENPEFGPKLINAFRDARQKDPKAAQYLSQVLALVGGPQASAALLESLKEASAPEQEIFVMIGLAKMQEAQAVPLILERVGSDDPGVRYAALFSLGFFQDSRAIVRLRQALDDPDPLAQWNAAFSLARLSGRGEKHFEAVPVLERLLDLNFVRRVAAGADKNRAPLLQPDQIELYRTRAVQLLGIFLDERVRSELKKVADGDEQLGVRQAALDVLNGRVAPATDR